METIAEVKRLSELETLNSNLGKGFSSTVSLVRHKASGYQFALKSVPHDIFPIKAIYKIILIF